MATDNPEASKDATAQQAVGTGNLDLILDLELPLAVRFGKTEMTLEALTKLEPGSLIDLQRSPEESVDVLVNGKLVAEGQVVVVGGNYGVRITAIKGHVDPTSGEEES
jgi:flagellar motor switch protein FliN/FliY